MIIIRNILIIIAAIVAGGALAANWDNLQGAADSVHAPATRGVTTQRVAYAEPLQRLVPAFPQALGRMAGVRLHECPYEDGDPSGRACLWQNPRTGKTYYVSSVEYLD
jgi:hypothetical protein